MPSFVMKGLIKFQKLLLKFQKFLFSIYKLPHELPIDLRFRILRNNEILENPRFHGDTALCPVFSAKIMFDTSAQNIRKGGYKRFSALSNFTLHS